MGLILVTPAETLVVSLEKLKTECRLDSDDFDENLTDKLASAISHVEEITRRALITQEWKLTLPRFPRGRLPIVLPKGRLQAVSEITYLDENGDRQTLDAETYLTRPGVEPAEIVPGWRLVWPSCAVIEDSVEVTFSCGFGDDAGDVPGDLRAAVLLHATFAFNGPETDQSLGGTDTARERAIGGLLAKWKLFSDDVADGVTA